MKRRSWAIAAVLLLCLLPIHPLQSKDPVVEPLTLGDLRKRPVIGELGVPLGTVVEIIATVFDGDELRMKAYADRYLLRIKAVNGKDFAEPLTLDFHVFPVARSIALARDESELLELKKRMRANELNEEQVRRIDAGYAGQRVRLLAFETGDFNGIPRGVPGDMIWQDHDWGFTTTLYLLRELSDPPVQKQD